LTDPIVRTLAGDIPPAALGLTLSHEHLIAHAPADLGARDPDLSFGTVEGARAELEALAAAGGRAVVEMTTADYGRDAAGALRAAEGTGVHVIQATGLQKGTTYPPSVEHAGVDELAAAMVADVREGIDGAAARAGVIKAGTCGTEAMRDDERKVFAAVAAAHHATGAPISTHLQAGTLGHEQLDAFAQGGVDPGRVLLGHLDRNLDWDYHRSLAERGCWLGYDHVTKSKYAPDETRAEFIGRLLEQGHDRILVSGDLGRGSYQPAYGGAPGFTGVLARLRELLDAATLELLTVTNPARFFAFAAR
jgi:predicted metal-dependent phosphotriesterase family hydrolase